MDAVRLARGAWALAVAAALVTAGALSWERPTPDLDLPEVTVPPVPKLALPQPSYRLPATNPFDPAGERWRAAPAPEVATTEAPAPSFDASVLRGWIRVGDRSAIVTEGGLVTAGERVEDMRLGRVGAGRVHLETRDEPVVVTPDAERRRRRESVVEQLQPLAGP